MEESERVDILVYSQGQGGQPEQMQGFPGGSWGSELAVPLRRWEAGVWLGGDLPFARCDLLWPNYLNNKGKEDFMSIKQNLGHN